MTEPQAVPTEETGLDWLEERKTGLGGSDAAAALGYGRFDKPWDVYDQKLGLVPSKEETGPMKAGKELEPIVARMWQTETGLGIRRQPMRRHRVHDCIIGNIDRQVFATDEVGTSLLEIKCPGIQVFQQYKLRGLSPEIICQIMHYLAVYDYDHCHVAIFGRERWELLMPDPIERDDSFISEMIDREVHFWHEFVLKGVRPPEDIPDLPDLPEIAGGEAVVWDTPEQLKALAELAEAYELRDDAKEILGMAQEGVQELMGDDITVVEGLSHRIYWREQAGRKTFQKKEFNKAHPDISLDPFYKQGKPSRPFKPYFGVVKGV